MTPSATLRHVVLFSFKDGANTEQVNAVTNEFFTLKNKIPGIRHLEWGTNVSPEGLNEGFTRCFTLTFDATESRDTYLVNLRIKSLLVSSFGVCLARSLVIDYWATS
jgi:hypothetical protein